MMKNSQGSQASVSSRAVKCLSTWIFLMSIPGNMSSSWGQIVQLPSVGSFSLQSSAYVPDSGTAFLGGDRSGRDGSVSGGPFGRSAFGSERSAASASVKATVIDLNELDRMIRSQAGPKSTLPDLTSIPSTVTSHYSLATKGTAVRSPGYGYLEALSHAQVRTPDRMNEDARYYLSLAASARQKAHWNVVELYYKLAWESLPEARREIALQALADAKKKEAEQKAELKGKGSTIRK